jgi:hypothetical protein
LPSSDTPPLSRVHIHSDFNPDRGERFFPKDALGFAENGGDYLTIRRGTEEVEFGDHEMCESDSVDEGWG